MFGLLDGSASMDIVQKSDYLSEDDMIHLRAMTLEHFTAQVSTLALC